MKKKAKLTKAQRRQIDDYYLQGYTMCIIHADGGVVPGYADWILEYVLQEIERKEAIAWFDEMGQAYRADTDDLVMTS